MQNLFTITNATKAQIIAVVNALLGLLIAFDIVFTQTQLSAIDVFVNAVLALFVGLTYTQSAKRVDDPPK